MLTRILRCFIIFASFLIIVDSLTERPPICDHFVEEGIPDPDVFFFKSKRLFLFYEDRTWTEAYKACKRIGLKLFSIGDAQENLAIGEYLKDRIYDSEGPLYTWTYLHIWTGGKRVNNTWLWVPQKSSIGYKSWGTNEPNNYLGVENCLELRTFNSVAKPLWGDSNCKEKKRYICENLIGGLG